MKRLFTPSLVIFALPHNSIQGNVNTKYNDSGNLNGFSTAVYPAVSVNLKNNFLGLNF